MTATRSSRARERRLLQTVFVAKPELVWRAPVALDVAEQSIHESSNARDDAGATSADGSVETARELETASASVGERDATAATTTSNATTTATATAKSDEPCALHLFRHVSKTGGTTVRFWFDRQTVLGEWEYPIPYGASREEWEALKTAWTDAARAYVNGTRAVPPRTLVEVRGHYPNSWSAQNFANVVFEDVLAMKEGVCGFVFGDDVLLGAETRGSVRELLRVLRARWHGGRNQEGTSGGVNEERVGA